MKIGAYKLLYGGWYPPTVRQYVHKRVENLGKAIENKLGINEKSNLEVRVFASKHSESAYIRLRLKGEDAKILIGFRNHGSFYQSQYDRLIALSKYETWLDCKHDFLANILPEVLEELYTVKWTEKQITNTLVSELTKAFREAGATTEED